MYIHTLNLPGVSRFLKPERQEFTNEVWGLHDTT